MRKINMIFRKLLTNGEIMLIITIAFCTAINTENDTTAHYHLPDYIIPLHYNVKIRFNYKANDIIGECNITIRIHRQTENISMHSMAFTIFKIILYNNIFSKKIYVPRYSFNNELNMFTIDFTKTRKQQKFLSPGKYILMISYIRHVNYNKEHFITSLFSNKKPDNMLIATDVDIMTAQQLFPCWDEIALNSTFKISIKHHINYTALSNMPIQEKKSDTYDMMWTHFKKSPLMLIKQIMVVITSFANNTTSTNVTIWSKKNVTNYLRLAQFIAQEVLYSVKLQKSIDGFSKIDYVAFWDAQHNNSMTQGLIIHSEADIIYDENSDTVGHKLKVSYLITNQIVSLWYNDVLLWSKTGFLTLLATDTLYQIFSNDDIMDLFIIETQRESFLFDTPSNADEINSLSYPLDRIKSSNIWRILYYLTTSSVFWPGIRAYVTYGQYNQTNDLWDIMQLVLHTYFLHLEEDVNLFLIEYRNLFIKEFTALWKVENYYYPVLYVTRNHSTGMTKFEYLTNYFSDKRKLPTFVTYTTKSILNFDEIFVNKSFWLSQEFKILSEEFNKNDWIIVNLQQTGYYRVNYDTENWLKLARYMNSIKYIDIHIFNRAQIIDDGFHFFTHNQLDYITFWKISAFLSQETNYVVWYPMFKAFEHMTIKIPIKDAEDVKKKMDKILSGALQKIEYVAQKYETTFIQRLREEAVKWACIIGNEKCREVANMQMARELQRSKNDTFVTQSALWKTWMYCNGFSLSNQHMWYDVFNKWIKTSNYLFLEYLTCFENPRLIKAYLELLTKNEFFIKLERNKHVNIYLLIIAKHAGNDIVYNFILQLLETHIYMYSPSNIRPYQIAILIVIITHQHSVKQLYKVFDFAKVIFTEERLVDAVDKKIKKRKDEHGRKVRNYGLFSLPSN